MNRGYVEGFIGRQSSDWTRENNERRRGSVIVEAEFCHNDGTARIKTREQVVPFCVGPESSGRVASEELSIEELESCGSGIIDGGGIAVLVAAEPEGLIGLQAADLGCPLGFVGFRKRQRLHVPSCCNGEELGGKLGGLDEFETGLAALENRLSRRLDCFGGDVHDAVGSEKKEKKERRERGLRARAATQEVLVIEVLEEDHLAKQHVDAGKKAEKQWI